VRRRTRAFHLIPIGRRVENRLISTSFSRRFPLLFARGGKMSALASPPFLHHFLEASCLFGVGDGGRLLLPPRLPPGRCAPAHLLFFLWVEDVPEMSSSLCSPSSEMSSWAPPSFNFSEAPVGGSPFFPSGSSNRSGHIDFFVASGSTSRTGSLSPRYSAFFPQLPLGGQRHE
jgi:hypothetical protein